jgi:hypothetical protein
VPPDVPLCGFQEELCPKLTNAGTQRAVLSDLYKFNWGMFLENVMKLVRSYLVKN